MNNYEYIIASLPYLTHDYKYGEGMGFGDIVAEIRENLSERYKQALDHFLKGYDPKALDLAFYEKALTDKNRFMREYFRFDVLLRNAKVRYLNRELGREPDTDVLEGEWGEFDEAAKTEAILGGKDLIAREKGLDDLCWEKIDSLALFHYFDLTAVLAYIAKLHIVDRWLSLDEEAGRELFRKLVAEVRGTFKGVQYNEQ